MHASQLRHGIQRVNFFRMIFPILFLFILLLSAMRFPIINCLYPTEEYSIKSASELYHNNIQYVKSTSGKLYYTGYDYLRGSSVKGHYFYSLVDGKCTIYLFSKEYFKDPVPATVDNLSFKAKLISNSSNLENLLSLMARDMNWTYDGLANCTDPIMISEMNYAVIPSVLISIFLFFAFSFTLAHILILLFNIILPQYTFSFLELGHFKARKKAILKASKELETSVNFQSENMYITDNYFIYISNFNIAIIPLSKIAWVYKYSRLHRYFLFGEMTYNIRVITKIKGQYLFTGKTKEAADNLNAFLEAQNKNILIGYTNENRIHSKEIIKSLLSHLLK